MIDQVDQQLQQWAQDAAGGWSVSLEAPQDGLSGSGVNVYLLHLSAAPPPSTGRTAPHQFYAHYLVSTWASDSEAAHRALGALLLAAMDQSDMDVELTPPPLETWRALGVKPRPAFSLRVLVRRPRPEPATHYVKSPLVIQTTPTAALAGVLRAPGGLPLARARVELPALNQSTESDDQGRFRFPTVPAGRLVRLVVKAKGRVWQVEVPRPEPDAEPLVVEIDPLLSP